MRNKEIVIFYNKYRLRLFYTSLRILNDKMDAEEVVHDTILKYLKNKQKLTKEQTEAWLTRTCINASLDIIRKRKRDLEFIESIHPEIESENKDLQDEWQTMINNCDNQSELITLIKEEIKNLPTGYRTILSLLLFEGLDYSEIATILQIKESTIRSQYLRAKKKIAQICNKKKTRTS